MAETENQSERQTPADVSHLTTFLPFSFFFSQNSGDNNELQSMFRGGSSLFKDQVCTLTQWFGEWSDCEQTVALYTILRQLDSKQARFIENLLQEQASTDPNVDDLENQANDLGFVQSLSESISLGELINLILLHFPLLHPGNDRVKDEYLKIIPKILSKSVEMSTNAENCRKLLTYTLIHPAISNEERSQFTKWLVELERQYSLKITATQLSHANIQQLASLIGQIDSTIGQTDSSIGQTSPYSNNNLPKDSVDESFCEVDVSYHKIPLHATSSAPPYANGLHVITNNSHKKLSRTSSCSSQKKVSDVTTPTCASRRSQQHANEWIIGTQPETMSPAYSEHALLSPQSSISSSDSDQEGIVFYQENSGMKEFPAWLKSLRLHKYCPLFASLSYEEMLSVDENWLEEKKVTQGARKKLAQSLGKLRERSSDLREMEQNVIQGTNLKQVLTDLKAIVWSPIKPTQLTEGGSPASEIPETDLPSLVNRLMGRLCTQLLVNSRVEDDCYPLYVQLIDKCLHHEAFTIKQRKLLQEWRAQVLQRNSGRMITARSDLKMSAHKPTGRTNSWNPATRRGSKGNVIYTQRPVQTPNAWSTYDKKPLTVSYSGPDTGLGQSPQTKPAMIKSAIHRTHSAPIKAHQALTRKAYVTEPEINARLDSLARSMTEAALSSQDSIEHTESENPAMPQ